MVSAQSVSTVLSSPKNESLTYGMDVQTSATSNPEPYCAELYNARELPYGFFSFDLPQLFGEGFPVFFDINLSADEVQTFYQYVEEGLYYDSNTRYAPCPGRPLCLQAQTVYLCAESQVFR